MLKSAVLKMGVGSVLLLAACSSTGTSEPDADPAPVVVFSDTAPPDGSGDSVPDSDPGEPVGTGGSETSNGVVGDVRAATVRVSTTGTYVAPGVGEVESLAGSGSAFVIDPSGLAVTNNHVVAGAAVIEVFFDGSSTAVPASVVGTSECSDLAVIQLSGDGFPALGWSSDPAGTGTLVQAGGYPDGVVEFTLSEGIVSRESSDGATPWAAIPSLLQHDATLRPGNSGGPLVDSSGRVVGVNTATSTAAQFSVPTPVAQPIVERLAAGEDVDSVGLNVIAVRDEVTNEAGVWVVSVRTGSIADRAGIEPGDFIVRMQGIRVGLDGTLADYCRVIRTAAGTPVQVEIVRDDDVLAGTLGTDEPLMPVLEFTDTLEPAAVSHDPVVAPEPGVDYTGYERVVDDTGALAFDVPVEWSDRQTSTVLWGSAQRPSLSASSDIGAFEQAAGTTYDVSGIAAMVFGVGASMTETFDVMVDNSPWASDCDPSTPVDFDDGIYRGRAGVFTNCNGGPGSVITLTVERIGTDRWMLMNVFIVTLADLDAAVRALETFDFLTDTDGNTTTTEPATTDTASADDNGTAGDSDGELGGDEYTFEPTVLPEAAALFDDIGAPEPAVLTTQTIYYGLNIIQHYELDSGETKAFDWLLALPERIGCDQTRTDGPTRDDQFNETTASMSCTVTGDSHSWTVTVNVVIGDDNEFTTVNLAPL